MAQAGRPEMRLKEWLLAQVESGQYPGLRWENSEKTVFRIPWKHAAKQDYREAQDAALFKAWAIYKGKYHEGLDKADPSAWKTRLRCALNKSGDFKEVLGRRNLDISEPYKVYQVISASAPQETNGAWREAPLPCSRPPPDQESRKESPTQLSYSLASVRDAAMANCKLSEVRSQANPSSESDGKRRKEPGSPQISQKLSNTDLQGYQVKGFFYAWDPSQLCCHPSQDFIHPSSLFSSSRSVASDFCLRISVYYCNELVKEVTTSTVEGCRLTYRPVPAENECLYGPSGMEEIQFPPAEVLAGKSLAAQSVGVLQQLLPHLHRGVLLWVAPEGVFVKRQCQGRVYWRGPLAPHSDRPNKLEREKTYQLLDMRQFLQRLQGFLLRREPLPQYRIHFCFGEEFPPAPSQNLCRFIMAQVEPVFACNLCLQAQQSLQDPGNCPSDAPGNIIQILKQLCSS